MFVNDLTSEMKAIIGLDKFFNDGGTFFDIKERITKDFDDFFCNKQSLKSYAGDFLISDWVNYIKYTGENSSKNDICEILKIINEAKDVDALATLQVFADFQESLVHMGDKYWSMLFLESDKSKLQSYEYITACFEVINSITEIAIKPFLAVIVAVNRIRRSKQAEFSTIATMKFGNLVNELVNSSNMGYLLSDCGLGISVSQWRNIACHKSYYFSNNTIICNYGNDLSKELVLQKKEDVLNIARSIAQINRIFNFATKFFVYDNAIQIGSLYQQMQPKAKGRDETWQLTFITKLLANGFEVRDIENTGHLITVKVDELTNLDHEVRAIQVSKAIYDLWFYSRIKNAKIKIIYYKKNDIPYLSAESTSDICEKIGCGDEELHFLAENANFKLL